MTYYLTNQVFFFFLQIEFSCMIKKAKEWTVS